MTSAAAVENQTMHKTIKYIPRETYLSLGACVERHAAGRRGGRLGSQARRRHLQCHSHVMTLPLNQQSTRRGFYKTIESLFSRGKVLTLMNK